MLQAASSRRGAKKRARSRLHCTAALDISRHLTRATARLATSSTARATVLLQPPCCGNLAAARRGRDAARHCAKRAKKAALGLNNGPPPARPRNDVFVGNIAFGTTDEDIRRIFSEVGRVKNVRMAVNSETGKPAAFAS